jgi:hypothetical protein
MDLKLSIDDILGKWLTEAAVKKSVSPEQYIMDMLSDARAAQGEIKWQESDLLQILRKLDAKPGKPIFAHNLYLNWVNKAQTIEDLDIGINGLVSRGWIELSGPDNSTLSLTHAGYKAR